MGGSVDDLKVQIVGGEKTYQLTDDDVARLLATAKIKRSFGGAEIDDPEYGGVKVKIGSGDKAKEYTVVLGNWQWIEAERELKVTGVQKISERINSSEEAQTIFCQIALRKHHKNLKLEDVAVLRDWRAEGQPTLWDAVQRAMTFSKPHHFSDEEVDPKALRAVQAALMLMVQPQPDSTSTT